MILVFGATGQIGGELISLLAADGVPTRAVTRDLRRRRRVPDSHG